jgi:DNA polymerase III sliding clamp (beta) subunit (PCNA family)
MREDFVGSMKVHRNQFSDTLERLMVLARQDKLPALNLNLDAGGLVSVLTLDLNIPDKGRIQDSIDVDTEYEEQWTASFTPAKIVKAVSFAKTDYIHIDFGHENPDKSALSMIRLRDEKDYVSYIMPRKAP